jgi:MFS family permease
MAAVKASTAQPSIIWRQVWGLSAILAAVTLSWMAYGLYQPKLLQDLGFASAAVWLGVAQGILGALIEPIIGGISDRVQSRSGSRLPMITIGVTLAGLLFVSLALLLQWQIPRSIRWVIPALMTFWVMAMIAFRGPVVALLRQAAPLAKLPQANALLTMIFGIIGALAPLLTAILEDLGASLTFLSGAIVLTLGAALLYKTTPRSTLFMNAATHRSSISRQRMGIVFAVGMGSGIEANLLLRSFPQVLHLALPDLSADGISALMLMVSALVALPMGYLTSRIGVKRSMIVGLSAIALCQGLLLLSLNMGLAIILLLLGGAAFGLVFESQIPLALGMVPPDRAGLGTGLYFGGIGASTALVSGLLQSAAQLSVLTAFLLAMGALGVATLSLLLPRTAQRDPI